DSMGRYRMVSMCPGDYEVEAINGDFKASRTITTQIGKTNELDLAVEGGGTLTVTLRDERNAAVEIPMTTKHFNLRDSEAIRLPDAAFGTAVFQGIKPGSYELMMMLPGYGRRVDRVVINEGENALTMSLAIGGRLEGRLRFDRTPPSVPAYYVKATRADENYKHYADPDQDGMFRFESLNLGEWTVEVMNWGTREALIVRQVKIQPGDNFFDESLDIKGTLVVSVIDGATGATPRYECDVRLLDSQGRRQSVQTNKDGLAAFAGLEEGDYTLRIDPEYTSSGLPTTKQIHISAGDNEQSVRLDMADSLKITHIQPGSQAANAGIVNGDLLLTYKGEPTASYQQLRALIDATKDGEVVPLTVQRDGKTIQLKVEQWQGRMLGVNIDKAKSTAKSR
ncbi:MAG: PDZ domain-containing protein, partial [Planctomycetaceae bacterium]|nr:PDZ domain-containing protein [Planctomycetaceae bacterium]